MAVIAGTTSTVGQDMHEYSLALGTSTAIGSSLEPLNLKILGFRL